MWFYFIYLQENLGRLKGRGKSIVADWVDRNLYYLEEQNNDVQNAIMKYDLNRKPETSDIVLVRPALILGFIQVSPKQRYGYSKPGYINKQVNWVYSVPVDLIM